MSESFITLALVIAASIYFGVLIGRKNSRALAKQLVLQERERVRAEVKQEQTQIAVELHGELAKVRNSIIQSAHAYQHVVATIGEKLAPWEEVQKALQIDTPKDLPLLIAEEPEAPVTEKPSEKAEAEESSAAAKPVWEANLSKADSAESKSDTRPWSTGATREVGVEELAPANTTAAGPEAPTAEMDVSGTAASAASAVSTTTLSDEIVTEGVAIHSAGPEAADTAANPVAKERFISSTRSLH